MGADEDRSKKYDQEFFLALAAKGKDAWNAWRRDPANNGVRVTFAGIDFSEPPRDKIDFSGFEFGDYADFSGCKWRGVELAEINKDLEAFAPGRALFSGATFGQGARFDMAAFGRFSIFTGASFGAHTTFVFAAFGNDASFADATFGQFSIFTGAAFGNLTNFAGASFGNFTNFDRASFGSGTTFISAAFANGVLFDDTLFKGRVIFTGKSIEQWTKDFDASVHGIGEEARIAWKKRHEDFWKLYRSGPDRFQTIWFERARFHGEAIFSGRSFERTANFTNARFYFPPDFDRVTNAARIDFTGIHIGFVPPGKRAWTRDGEIPLRLRAFRKVAEETKNHDLERDLYIEERKAERGVYLRQRFVDLRNESWKNWPRNVARLIAHILWIAVMGFYWALADYGRSFAWPAAWLVSSAFFFYWRYTEVLARLMAKAPDIEKYKQAVRMLALGNAVPFVGPLTIDGEVKKFLFCAGDANCLPIPPEGFQLLVVGQNVLSITCVFFIGLALRNYFRIK